MIKMEIDILAEQNEKLLIVAGTLAYELANWMPDEEYDKGSISALREYDNLMEELYGKSYGKRYTKDIQEPETDIQKTEV